MDHAVGVGGRLGQAVGVVEVPPLHDGSGGFQPAGGSFGAGQADHLVSGVEQLGNHGRADPARRTRDEDSHDGTSNG